MIYKNRLMAECLRARDMYKAVHCHKSFAAFAPNHNKEEHVDIFGERYGFPKAYHGFVSGLKEEIDAMEAELAEFGITFPQELK